MKAKTKAGMGWILIALLMIWPFYTWSQEKIKIHTSADTMMIHQLINDGQEYIFTRTDSALHLFREAEEMSRAGGYDDGIGYALANTGLALTTLGDYKAGFAAYNTALPYCIHAKQLKIALIHLYFNVAMSWADKEDYLKANQYYHKAIDLLQQRFPDNQILLLAIYNNLIAIQVNMGSYEQALAYAEKAYALGLQYHKTPQLAQVIMNKGDIFFSKKSYDSALFYYKKALPYIQEGVNKSILRSYYLRMGDVLLEQKQYKEALTYLQDAHKLSKDTRPLEFINTSYSLGDALYRLGRYTEAEKVILPALKMATETGLVKNKQNGHAVLLELYKKEGRYKEAFDHLSAYQQLSDSIISIGKVRTVNEIEIKYQVAEKDKILMQKELRIAQQDKKLYQQNLVIGSVILISAGAFFFYRYTRKLNLRDRKIEQLKAMMEGEEKERIRLSRELHDGLGGMLTGIRLNLRSIQRQSDPELLRKELTGIMSMLQEMGEEIRFTAHNLMPDMLVKHRIKEALQLYCEQISMNGNLKIELQCMGDFQHLDISFELHVYRIIQELVQNIVRHARASSASIQIRVDEQKLLASVEDNGTGFDTETENKGAGLHNIKARVEAVNGYFSLASHKTTGTTVYIELPVSRKQMSI